MSQVWWADSFLWEDGGSESAEKQGDRQPWRRDEEKWLKRGVSEQRVKGVEAQDYDVSCGAREYVQMSLWQLL